MRVRFEPETEMDDEDMCLAEEESIRALRERAERLRALSNAAYEGIVIHEGGRVLDINDAYTRMFGYSRAELLGKPVTDMVAPESRETVCEHIAGRVEEPYEFTALRKDGTTFPAEVRGRAITYLGREARAGVIRDLTLRKETEAALEEERARLRTVLRTLPVGVVIADASGGVIEGNDAFYRIWGETAPKPGSISEYREYKGRWADTGKELRPEDWPMAQALLTGKPQAGNVVEIERFGGGTATVILSATPLRDPEGRLIGGVLVVQDVTDLRVAEEELRRSRDLLQSVIDNTPAAIYVKDLDGTIILANNALADLLDHQKEEMIGKTSFDFYPPEVAEEHTENDREVMRRGRPVSSEEIVPENGSVRTFLSIKFPLKDDAGDTYGVGGVSTEITERVRAEQAMARALEESRRDRKRLEAMENIAEAGISATDLDEVLDAVADRISEALGTHSCAILLLEGDELVARAARGIPEECGFRIRAGECFLGKVLSSRRTIYVADAEHDPLVISPHIKRKGVKSLLGAPMIARGRLVGALYVDEMRVREFTSDERRLLEAMASRTALIVENTRLFEQLAESRDEAQRNFVSLQRSLLPAGEMQVPGYDAAVSYVSPYGLEIGGDFYDLFETESGCHGVLIGDVAGKGVPAVSLAITTRSTIRSLVYDIPSVGEALKHTNSVLCPQEFAMGETSFVTALAAVIDPANGKFRYVSAGHPPPAVYRRANSKTEFLEVGDPPLRVVPGVRYEEHSSYLHPGDKLVLYTDGLSEARRGSDLFGPEGIRRVLRRHGHRPPEEVVTQLNEAALRWSGGNITDDTLILVVERGP